MRVIEISPRTIDNRASWRVTLEGTDKPLWVFSQPSFKVGDDIPEDSLELSQKGNWKLKTVKQDKHYGKSPEETIHIQAQVAVKILSDIFIAGKTKELQETKDYLAINLRDWVRTAISRDPLMATIIASPEPSKTKAESPVVAEAKKFGAIEEIKTAGDLLTKAWKELKLSKSQVEKFIGPVEELTEEKYAEAYAFLVKQVNK